KAVRMLETGQDGLLQGERGKGKGESFLTPHTKRLFAIAQSFVDGVSVDEIYNQTGIDKWFLYQVEEIAKFEDLLRSKKLSKTKDTFNKAKKLGFSDKLLAFSFNLEEKEIRNLRKKWGVMPVIKQIDTLAGEFPAETNYLYLTYHGQESEQFSVFGSQLS